MYAHYVRKMMSEQRKERGNVYFIFSTTVRKEIVRARTIENPFGGMYNFFQDSSDNFLKDLM